MMILLNLQVSFLLFFCLLSSLVSLHFLAKFSPSQGIVPLQFSAVGNGLNNFTNKMAATTSSSKPESNVIKVCSAHRLHIFVEVFMLV